MGIRSADEFPGGWTGRLWVGYRVHGQADRLSVVSASRGRRYRFGAAEAFMGSVSSRPRFRPTPGYLGEYHSPRLCAPPSAPPAPSDKAGIWSDRGILASVD